MINFDRLKNPFLRTGSGLCNYIVSEAIQLYFAFSIDNDIKWHNDCSSIKKKLLLFVTWTVTHGDFFLWRSRGGQWPWYSLKSQCLLSLFKLIPPQKYASQVWEKKMYNVHQILPDVGQWTVFYSRNTKGGNSFNLCLEFEQIVMLHRCM